MMNAAKELLTFIENSPSMFHSIETIKGMLDEAGFTYLPERTRWDVKQGGTYYTIRNHSSIIAFRVGKELGDYHFQMCASHSDSPTYKIKNVPELNGPGEYLRLDVEAYGGMIDSTWFDRPLTVAGRVLVKDGQGVSARLLYIDKDLFIIPNVAIHFNREVNNGYKYNRQVDLCPLFSAGALKKEEQAMTDEKIARINALAKKSRTPEGLTAEEKAEQASLRREYIDAMKGSLKKQLDNTVVVDANGNRMPLKQKRKQ